MSGTTTQLGDPGLLAGIGTVAIDGTLYNISDVTYSPSVIEYEWLMGYNGPHGRKATYIPGFIAFKVRDDSTISVNDFQNMTNSEVIVNLANGKTATGHSMCCMKAVEVDANEAEFDVRFEGPSVSGT
jgi:hypothetical protein